MPASQPPPSSEIPGKPSNSGLYLAGAILLALLAGGLLFWKSKQTPPTVTAQAASIAVTSAAPPPPPPTPLYAPPPPPKIEEEPDAGADAGKQLLAKGPGGALPPAGPCGGKCAGTSTPVLDAKLRGAAQSAQGCYNRALRTSEASGSFTVSVQISSTGSVCGASIQNDTVNSGEISSCVLSRFRGMQFPAPSGGCVTANIPIAFKIKQ